MTLPVTLAIDTARERLQLALLFPDGRVDTDVTDIAKGHAEVIMDRISGLLARNGLAYTGLQRIAVTTGPGSFTGLRIGLSVARGLGLALSIPVIGVPTLLALSLSRDGASEIILDAGRSEAYVQSFSTPGKPADAARLADFTQSLAAAARTAPDSWHLDIERLARFAMTADPNDFPPDPLYVRAADAKAQTKGKVARQ